MKRSFGLVVGVAAAGFGLLAACQVIDGIHVYAVDDPEASVLVLQVDGGTVYQDGGVADALAAPLGDAACHPAKPPGPPDPSLVTSTAENVYILAFTSFSFTGNGKELVGYDLDDTCTGEPTTQGVGPQSCVVVPGGVPSVDSDNDPTDRGVDRQLDNVGTGYQFSLGGSIDSLADINPGIADGTQTALLFVVGYNGTANDSYVSVQLASSEWLESTDCRGPDAGFSGAVHPAPKRNGCDTWSRDRDALQADGVSNKYVSANAYVTNGTLVAQFGADVVIPFGDTSLDPNVPMVVAKLVFSDGSDGQDAGTISVKEGLLQGRIAAANLLTALGGVADPQKPSVHLCPDAGSPTYDVIAPALCANLDINGAADNTGAQPCDAFSFAASFDAISALVGDAVEPSHPVTMCASPPVPCPLASPRAPAASDGGP